MAFKPSTGSCERAEAERVMFCSEVINDDCRVWRSGKWSGCRNTEMFGWRASKADLVWADETVMGGAISGSVFSTSSRDLNITFNPTRVRLLVKGSVDSGRRE